MTRDVGDAVDTSTPARALEAQARRQIPSWHWLKVFLEGQRIALESITEAASSGKKQIARDADLRQLTAQILGTVPDLERGLRDVLLRKRLDCLLLGAEFIPQEGYRTADIAAILEEFTKQQTLPRDDARWPSARLTTLPASRETLGVDVERERRADQGAHGSQVPSVSGTASLPSRSSLLDPRLQAQIDVVFKALDSIAKEHPESISTIRTSWSQLQASLGEVSPAARGSPWPKARRCGLERFSP